MAKIAGGLGPRQERASAGRGNDDDLGHQASTADTLDGIVRLEDEGARHRGQRQVQRHVDQDRHEEGSAAAHAEILPDGGVTDRLPMRRPTTARAITTRTPMAFTSTTRTR